MFRHNSAMFVFVMMCLTFCKASHINSRITERDQLLECPVVTKGDEECFMVIGDCRIPENVFRQCLNPLGVRDKIPARSVSSQGDITNALERTERSYCAVYNFKGQACYFRPIMSKCVKPPSVKARCAQGYGGKIRRMKHSVQSADPSQRSVDDSTRSVHSVGATRRSVDVTKRSVDGRSALVNLAADNPDVDEVETPERRKRTTYYYDSYEYYEDEPDECRVYKVSGRNCYWRPVGNDCVPPSTVVAKCLELPDLAYYDPYL